MPVDLTYSEHDVSRRLMLWDADGSVRLLCTPQVEAHIYIAILQHSQDVWRGAGAVRCPVTAATGGTTEGIHSGIPKTIQLVVDRLPVGRLERSAPATCHSYSLAAELWG